VNIDRTKNKVNAIISINRERWVG